MSILLPSSPTEAESADEEAGSSQQGANLEKEEGRQTKRKDGEEGERSGRSSPEEKKGDGEEGEKDEAAESVLTEEDLIQQSQAEYDSGRYSPTLLQPSELPLDTHIMKVEEDLQRLLLARRQLQVTGAYRIIDHSDITHTTCFTGSLPELYQEKKVKCERLKLKIGMHLRCLKEFMGSE